MVRAEPIARVNDPCDGRRPRPRRLLPSRSRRPTRSSGTPGIDVGLFPMMIMAVLARLVPRRALLDMMPGMGRKLTAAEAHAYGIVGGPSGDRPRRRRHARLADTLASKPGTLALGLRAFAQQDDMDLAAALPMLRDRLGVSASRRRTPAKDSPPSSRSAPRCGRGRWVARAGTARGSDTPAVLSFVNRADGVRAGLEASSRPSV